ncbi:hypothetical protein [Corynebacterium glutamicum]|nr:hypothetical protein [Corynebacterium glutamicum]
MSNQEATQRTITGEKEMATRQLEQWWAWFQRTGLQITGGVLKD